MPRLVVKNGMQEGQGHSFSSEEQSIGRGADNDIRLTDPSVSRRHAAVFRKDDGRYFIMDRGSTYGMTVNGRRVRDAELVNGAEIRMGEVVLEFIVDPDEDQDVLPPVADRIETDTGEFTVLHSLSALAEEEEDLAAAKQRIQIALEVSTLLRSTGPLGDLFHQVLEQTMRVVKAKNAAIFTWDSLRQRLELASSLDSTNSGTPVAFSRSIVMYVIRSGESLLIADAGAGGEMATSMSVAALGIKSAMCVPLRHEQKILGVLMVDSTGRRAFSKDDLHLLKILGNIAGAALVQARLTLENLRTARLAAIGESMAGLAHDIKNIMAGIKSGSYMVDQGVAAGGGPMLEMGWELTKASQDRINQLVYNMLDWSRERAPHYEEVNLSETLGNVRDLVALRGKDRSVEVALDVSPDAAVIEAEGVSIHRCVLNLASNALDALPEDRPGRIVIRCRADEEDAWIDIDVEDNGVGIPAEKLPELFQAFVSTKGAKGTGLGLAVSRKIAREHRGDIAVESKEGEGTTFTVRMPRKHPQE